MALKSIRTLCRYCRNHHVYITIFALALVFFGMSPVWQVNARAIWTTDSVGIVQDGNNYHYRCAVYVDGNDWPANTTLYIRVTMTSGASLNYGGPSTVTTDGNGEFGPTGPLCPYDIAPNGEYKAWVSLAPTFSGVPGGTKTDNFKVEIDVDLAVTKVCETLVPGATDTLAYTITVENLEDSLLTGDTAESVILEDLLPGGLSNATYSLDGAAKIPWTGSLSLGDMAPATSHTIEIYADVNAGLTSIAANTAYISSSTTDSNSANDSSTCTNQLVDVRLLLTPNDATNAVGEEHIFTATLQSTTDGTNWVGVSGADIDFSWSGVLSGSETVATNGSGVATKTLTSNAAGTLTMNASFDGEVAGVTVSKTATPATKTWVDAKISLSPPSATNAVGQPHEITATVQVNDGTGWADASTGTVSFSLSMVPGTMGATISPLSDTPSSGTLVGTLSSSNPGNVTISATYVVTVGGVTLTRTTGTSAGSGQPVSKTYIDVRLLLTPNDATNAVGEEHIFTATLQSTTDGTNWVGVSGADIDFSWSGVLSGSETVATNGSGVATKTLTSNAAGTLTMNASFDGEVAGVTVSKTATPATKTWVDAKISLSPPSATNAVGQPHEITATVQVNDGTGWADASTGTVSFSLSMVPGTMGATISPLSDTPSSGTLVGTLSSSNPGNVTISATYVVTVGGVTLTRTTGTSAGSGQPVSKTYIDVRLLLTPNDATNAVGEEHIFTATLQSTTDGTNWVGVSGADIDFSWSGVLSGSETVATNGSGVATKTLTSNAAGTLTMNASFDGEVAGVTVSKTATPATKTWVDAKISLSPPSATNAVGQPHEITATVQVNDGTGWADASTGTVSFSLSMVPGTMGATISPLSDTPSSGTLVGTLSSSNPGNVTISATYVVTVGGVTLTRTTGTSAGSGQPVSKTYIDVRLLLTPNDATNAVGEEHIFTATLQSTTDGTNWVGVSGADIDFSWSGVLSGSETVATNGSGVATKTLTSNAAGTLTMNASFDGEVAGVTVSKTATPATKTWVDAKISLSPPSATNAVGQPHEITATVQVNDGTGWADASTGTVSFSLSMVPGTMGATISPLSDTPSSGTLVGTLSSSNPGNVTISATYVVTVGGVTLTRTTGTSAGSGQPVSKTYIDVRLLLTPNDATNAVGEEHIFTATLQSTTDGTNWVGVSGADIDFSWSGVLSGSETVATNGSGVATKTLTSNAAGTLTMNASFDGEVAGVTVSKTATPATKTWVDAKISLSPPSATNAVGQPHEITATVQVNDGTGWADASTGTVSFSLSMVPGTMGATISPLSDTPSSGTLVGTLSSSNPGNVTISATYVVTVGGVTLTRTTGTSAGSGQPVSKTYIDVRLLLTPNDATNAVGEEHIFTATLQSTTDGTNWVGVSGADIDFSWSGVLSGSETVATNGSGVATKTLTSNAAGTLTMNASFDGEVAGVTVSKTATPATKTWVDAKISLSPPSATNAVGQPHEITATVQVNDGTGWADASTGTVSFSLSMVPGTMGATISPLSDTPSSGTLVGTLSSSNPGNVTISATYVVTVGGVTLTRTTGTSAGSGQPVSKTYIDVRLLLTPNDATNAVGEEHIFTATLQSTTDGTNWVGVSGADIDFSWSGVLSGSETVATNGSGVATKTLTSNAAGTLTMNASFDGEVAGVTVSKTATPATKTWVDAKISLSPPSATNAVGQPHEITATVQVNDGTGWADASTGTVSFSLSMVPGTMGATISPLSDTPSSGTLVGTLSSSNPGNVTISATYVVTVGGVTLTRTTGTSAGSGQPVSKTYIDVRLLLTPNDATNAVGEEHIFTATLQSTTDGTNWVGVSGADIDFSWSGVLSGSETVATNGSGVATKTLTSNAAGTLTMNASFDGEVAGVTVSKTATPATKTWVDAKITLTPLTATNEVESPHTFYALVKVNDGSGWAAISGATVVFTRENNNAGATIVDSDTTTDVNGQAWVKINSSAPGSVEIHASTTVEVGGITLARATDGTGQNSGNAKKIYVTTGIKIEKSTNGEDADTVTGPLIPTGLLVNWIYTVTNTGDIPISNVQVNDDNGTPGNSGDDFIPTGPSGDNGNGLLDPSEIWTYTAQGIAVAGQYENIGRVTGEDSLGGDLTDSDFSHYFGANPAIELLKTGTLNDDDGTPGLSVGDTISYAFKVTNTGNVTLTNVTLADTVGGVTISGGAIASLAPGAFDDSNFTGSYTITQTDIDLGKFDNTATVTGTPPVGADVSDPDTETVPLEQGPAIELLKTGTLNDDDGTPGLSVGDTISYAFKVTNTGNVTLTNVTLADTVGGVTISGGAIASLAPGAFDDSNFTGSYTITQTDIDLGKFDNTATVTGTPPVGADVSDPDTETVPLEQGPAIELLKTGTLNDDDGTPGLSVGDTISYAFKVTNTGNVTLTNVTLADTVGGVTISGGAIASLAPGAFDDSNFTGSYTITQTDIDLGKFDNTATVTGTPPVGADVSDPDTETVPLEQGPAIELLKTGTLNDDDGTPGLSVGDTISYAFKVTNTGNVTLTNVTLADTVGGVTISGGAIASLAPGAFDDSNFTGSYTITQTDIDLGKFDNTATVTGTPPVGADVSDPDTETVPLEQGPAIELLKTGTLNDDDGTPGLSVGDTISYAFKVTNTGNVTLTNVTLADTVGGVTISGGAIASLAPGAFDDSNFTGSYTITQTDIDLGKFDNTATVTGTPPVGADVSDPDTETVPLEQGPAIELLKTGTLNDDDGTPGLSVGDTISYAFKVTNTGNVTLTNVTLADTVGGVTISGGAIASLAPGAFDDSNFTGSYTITQTDIDLGKFDNTATVTGTPPVGADVSDPDTETVPLEQGPAIELLKTGTLNDDDGTPGLSVGDTISYAFKVTNTGNVTLTNVTLADTVGGVTISGGAIASLAPGAFDDSNFTGSYTITQTDIDLGKFDNTATVTGTPPVGADVSDPDTETVPLEQGPAIELLKTGTLNDDDGTPGLSVGDTISYAFKVTNTGNVTLSNVTVADKVGGVTVSGGPLASLGVGASDSTTFTGSYTITQVDIDAGTFTNTAEATGTPSSGPPVTGEDSDTQELTQSPAIDIEKSTNGQDADSAPGPSIAVGAPITWTYVVTNTGNVTLTNITVTDSDLGAVGTIASLASGVSQTLTMTGTAVAGQYANTGTATVIFGDTTYTDSDDSHYFGAGADLSLTKSVDNVDPSEGDTIVYTITITNDGPSDATDVEVTDALPAGLTYVSDSGAGAYSSATNVWTVSSLINGASVTLAITATVDTGTAGTTIANTAEVTAAGQPDPDSTPNNHDPDEDDQSSVSITVQSADLVVDKTVDNPTPNEGATIVYTITITNDGPSDATGVTLTDLLPIGVTYVSDNGGGAYDSATGVWTVGSIAVGDTAVLEITATVDAGTAGTTITNTAEITTSDQPDPDDTNNRDSADITVTEEPAGGGGATEDTCEGRVIINEVAWAGTAADSRDEWIELRNLGTIPVDLTGWTLSWRRKQPTTEDEYRWKVVDLSGILLPASISACELADNDYTPSVEFIKRDTDDLSWWILGKHEDKDESYYTIERRHDETISNEEANLLYDITEPYEMELADLGDVIQLRNDLGEVVDTANASHPERDGWPAGSAATFATMERTDPLAPDTWENWHTNLGIITRGLDAQEQPLIATADTLNSKELEELALNAELPPTKTRAGARLEVGLDLPREDRMALGWPWIRVTQPDLAEAAGGGGAVEAGAGFSFSGRYSGDLYWLGIDTGGLLPGQYNIWVVYGEGKAVLVPIIVLP